MITQWDKNGNKVDFTNTIVNFAGDKSIYIGGGLSADELQRGMLFFDNAKDNTTQINDKNIPIKTKPCVFMFETTEGIDVLIDYLTTIKGYMLENRKDNSNVR